MSFKPLLAATLEVKDFDKMSFPKAASAKLDGIRIIIIDGVAMTRNLKPLRNEYVQSKIGNPLYNGLDGEIIVGDPCDSLCYRTTSSGVMSADGEPDFRFYCFDDTLAAGGWTERFSGMGEKIGDNPFIVGLEHVTINNEEELVAFEEKSLQEGYEGIMLRDPNGKYKNGRSTLKEGVLLKLKRFLEKEATIVDFQERMHNANEAKTNALGHTERSTHKENLIGRGDLGALIVKDKETGVQFPVGSGFTDAVRAEIWNDKDKFRGKTITYKFMAYGDYDLPRFPVFKGIREDHE